MKFRVLLKTRKNIWILSGIGVLLTRIGISKTVSITPADQNGRNAIGEPVASGVYFYTLKAGEFSATKKMLIRK